MRRNNRVFGRRGATLVAAVLVFAAAHSVSGASGSTTSSTLPIGSQAFPTINQQLSFPTVDNGWFIGVSNQVWRTTDAGRQWTTVYRGPYEPVMLDAYGSNTAWLVALHNLPNGTSKSVGLLRTSDGGARWENLGEPAGRTLFTIDFTSATDGYAITTGGTLLSTHTGGETWSPVQSPTEVGSVCATSSGTVWVGSADGHVYKKTRDQSAWKMELNYAAFPPSPGGGGTYIIHPLLSCNGDQAIALYDWGEAAGSSQYEFMQTLDGGEKWSLRFSTTVSEPYRNVPSVNATIQNFGSPGPTSSWILGYCGPCGYEKLNIATTTDGFKWSKRSLPVGAASLNAAFANSHDGWIVATPYSMGPFRHLYVFATTNGGVSWHRVGTLPTNIG
jgi:photosystem II stability/assembly factor-like uncharacterized protein